MQTRFLFLCTCLAILAQVFCCCSSIAGPRPPYTITPSDDVVKRLRERWQQSIQASPDGSVSLTITEEEMTSLMEELLARQGEDLPIDDPQVFFRNGRIEVYATMTQSNMPPMPGMVALSATAVNGEIEISIEEARVGPLSVPSTALEEATQALNDALEQSVADELGNVTITGVQIGNQEMIISGKVAP